MSDNIFIQRLWRTVKYEEDYLKDYKDVQEAVSNLKSYFAFTITNVCIKPWAIRRRRRSTLGKRKSERRLRRDQRGDAVGQPGWGSSLLGAPGATFSVENWG